MSITSALDFNQLILAVEKKAEKDNQIYENMYWVYKDFDGGFVGATVRMFDVSKQRKEVRPWVFIKGRWISKKFWDIARPIYGVHLLKIFPNKPILFVEGEKTADAGHLLFHEFNVVTWPGGSDGAKNIDLALFHDKKIYLLPDNDEPGYKAMDVLANRLYEQNNELFMVDIKKLGVGDKWDIADLNDDDGEVEDEDVRGFVLATKKYVHFITDFDHSTYPDLSGGDRPRPLDTTDNVIALLQHFKIKVSWNMMKRIRNVIVPGIKFYEEESENASLTYITNLAVKNGLNVRRIDKHLDAIGWSNTFHPVRNWILSNPLKQKNIFHEFLKCIQTTNNHLSYILIKRWMISAIAALFNDSDFCAQGVLVIQGEPGTHKSSFIMSLVPHELKAIKGGASLDPSKKDDVLSLAAYWIAELGEIGATFRRADIDRLKSHVTNDQDDVRRPYAVRNSQMIRRTVYAATVNDDKYLVDTTGNRRWWTVSITEPIDTRHGLDMQQIWRCVYEMWKNGESPILLENESKLLNEINKQFEHTDPFDEKLSQFFNWEWPNRIWMSASQVLERIGYEKPNRSQTTRMGSLLKNRKTDKKLIRGITLYNMPILNVENIK